MKKNETHPKEQIEKVVLNAFQNEIIQKLRKTDGDRQATGSEVCSVVDNMMVEQESIIRKIAAA